jgi:hypothetical protein
MKHTSAVSSAAAAAAAPTKKTDTLLEHVLYLGAFNSETKHPIFSHANLELVKHVMFEEVRKAIASGRAEPALSMSKRTCTYPLNASGERQAIGSTCEEEEVTL